MTNSDRPRTRAIKACASSVVLAALALLLDAAAAGAAVWCARYPGGGSNCGFSTQGQCLASVSGAGGTCSPEAGGAAEPSKRRAKARPEPKKKQTVTRPRPAPVAAPAAPTPAPTAPAVSTTPPAAPAAAPAAMTAPAAPQMPGNFAAARQLILGGQYQAGLTAMQALGFDDHPEVAAYIGLAHRKLGRVADARAWYDKALRADPNHLLTLSFSGMLRAEQGDLGAARSDLEKIGRLCGSTICSEYRALEAVIAGAGR